VVGARDVANAHPGMDRFVAMMGPVNGIAKGTKRMQPGETHNQKERSNNQPLLPTKAFQSRKRFGQIITERRSSRQRSSSK